MKDTVTAIIMSAGVGSRMNSDIPKQYIRLHDKTILSYTIEKFMESDVDEIVIVAAQDYVDYCKENYLYKEEYKKVTLVVCGGKERYESVYSGLKSAVNAGYVLIHDAARPFISVDTINMTIKSVKKNGSTIVAVRPKDTIKMDTKTSVLTIDRGILWQVQTPQAFEKKLIEEAYDKLFGNKGEKIINITDDSQVLEVTFPEIKINVIEGNYNNIKITTPDDLKFAEQLLKKPENKGF